MDSLVAIALHPFPERRKTIKTMSALFQSWNMKILGISEGTCKLRRYSSNYLKEAQLR